LSMRIAYLDCFAGISGDMLLGALLDAGVPASVLHAAAAALDLGASLKIETVDRSGISAKKVNVLENGHIADGDHPSHTHVAKETTGNSQMQDQPTGREFERAKQLKTQHQHKTGRAHPHERANDAHDHRHVHGRSLTVISALIQAAPLHDAVKSFAIRAFELLGHSEAKIHGVPVDQIHFHEVGAVDAIVDIVAASAGIHHLQIGVWYSSPLNVGGGMIECAHGTFPVPAPATADLLRGFPTYSAHVQKELVTPTGAALLRALNPNFGPQPAMRVDLIGYGAGTRNPNDFPNVLRLSVGEQTGAVATADLRAISQSSHHGDTVTVLETALDDLSPQLIAYVAEKALSDGALDVMLTPVVMKKGRPGTLLTILCNPADRSIFEQLVLRETSTLGLRIRQDRRICLERSHTAVDTPYGRIRMKIGTLNGDERNAAPEFEDCRAAAAQHTVPLKQVQQAAIAAYAGKSSR
jgi:uncharacterized protein (TIGR00299 family) protein